MAKILIVEDDLNISRTLQSWLEKEKYVVETTASGKEGLDLLLHFNYDLAILDWQLPDSSGPEIARALQTENRPIPLLMLTSKGELNDRLEGLDSGVFDYLVKPCPLEELSARIRALLRRTIESDTSGKSVTLGNMNINMQARKVTVADKEVKFSPSEFEILKLMSKSPGGSFSVDAIFSRLWSDKPNVSKQLVKVHVMNLRKKMIAAESTTQLLTNDLNEYYLKL